MKKRRFALTKEEGMLVTLALLALYKTFDEQEGGGKTKSAYNEYMQTRIILLKDRLEKYEWEVSQ